MNIMEPMRIICGWIVVFSSVVPAWAARPLNGEYTVPVADRPELKDAATFSVKLRPDRYETFPTTLEMPLPVELTGVAQTILLRQSGADADGVRRFESAQGDASCRKEGRTMVCEMAFAKLQRDPVALKALLETRAEAPDLIDQRMTVFRRFETEPIGVLSYKLRGRDRDRADEGGDQP